MTNDRERISFLVSRYLDGTITERDAAELEEAIQQDVSAAEIFYDLSVQHVMLKRIVQAESSLQQQAEDHHRKIFSLPRRSIRNWLRESPRTKWFAVAASILLCLTLVIIWNQFYSKDHKLEMATIIPLGPDIVISRHGNYLMVTDSMILMSSDNIVVPPNSRAKVCWHDKCHMSLDGYSNVTFYEKREGLQATSHVFLSHGTIHSYPVEGTTIIGVETPQMQPSYICNSKLTCVVDSEKTYLKIHEGQLLAVRKKSRIQQRLSAGDELIMASLRYNE